MADITITTVRPVRVDDENQITAPAVEAIKAGQYVRLDPTTGKIAVGNATAAGEVGNQGFIALNAAAIGEPVTAVKGSSLLDVGDVLGDLAFDAVVYLSDTDGKLADAHGTVTKIAGIVFPGWGSTTPDKLLLLQL